MEYDQVKWRRWTVIATLLCETVKLHNAWYRTLCSSHDPSHPTCTSNTVQWYERPCHVLWWSTFCLSDVYLISLHMIWDLLLPWFYCMLPWLHPLCTQGPIRLEWNSFVNCTFVPDKRRNYGYIHTCIIGWTLRIFISYGLDSGKHFVFILYLWSHTQTSPNTRRRDLVFFTANLSCNLLAYS